MHALHSSLQSLAYPERSCALIMRSAHKVAVACNAPSAHVEECTLVGSFPLKNFSKAFGAFIFSVLSAILDKYSCRFGVTASNFDHKAVVLIKEIAMY